jgi:hypothetical protein
MTPSENIVASCLYCGDSCPVGYGICHCGCGKNARIAPRTYNGKGIKKGFPYRCICGHKEIDRPIIEDALPFKIDGVYCRLIPLSQGQYTIVWESDYRWLASRNWYAFWCKETHSYYAVSWTIVEGKRIQLRMNRELLGIPPYDHRIGDHKNGVTLDNRRSNLREVDWNQNAINRKLRSNNKSGVKGVSWCSITSKWHVEITTYGKKLSLGRFAEFDKACDIRTEAEQKYHGEFARSK